MRKYFEVSFADFKIIILTMFLNDSQLHCRLMNLSLLGGNQREVGANAKQEDKNINLIWCFCDLYFMQATNNN